MPFKPLPGIFNNPAFSSSYEGYYASGGGAATGNIVNSEWNPNVGCKFNKSWTRNNNSSGRLSLAGGRVSTIWFRPSVWPENMAIIRFGSGEGSSGSGIKVKDGRLVIHAEVLYASSYSYQYNSEYGYSQKVTTYDDQSTYVDLGPWDSTTFPPDTWHMLAAKEITLTYNRQDYVGGDTYESTRTVYDYYLDGVKIDIPWKTTGVPDRWGSYLTYPNAGSSDYIHLGSCTWAYGEENWHTANGVAVDRNTLNYEGWFLDWRGYSNLTDQEIAALYAEGPYQI